MGRQCRQLFDHRCAWQHRRGIRLLSSGSAAQGAAFPIPSNLQGVSIQLNSLFSALFYAGPNQINVQLPLNLVNSPSYAATAVTGYGASAAVAVTVADVRTSGIFTINGQGTGQGAVLNLSKPARRHHASRQGAATTSRYIARAWGEVSNNPGIGLPAPADPLSVTLTTPTVSIGGVNALVQFSDSHPAWPVSTRSTYRYRLVSRRAPPIRSPYQSVARCLIR